MSRELPLMAKSERFYVEVIEFTPELSTEVMQKQNLHNRHVKMAVVTKYMEAMRRGEWDAENGETIKIDRKGTLMDGQHRLQAIIDLGKAQKLAVIFNVSSNCQKVIDNGSARTLSDYLTIQGKDYTQATSTALKLLIMNDRKFIGSDKFTNAFYINSLPKYPNLESTVSSIISLSNKYGRHQQLISDSILSFISYAGSRINKSKSDAFVKKLITNEEIEQGSPISLLISLLIKDLRQIKHYNRHIKLALIIKAFNAYMDNLSIKQLRWIPDNNEEYPFIKRS
jgi:hypothetical protein